MPRSRFAMPASPGTFSSGTASSIFPILGHLIEIASGQRSWDYFREQVTNRLGVDYHFRMQPAELARFSADLETQGFLNNRSVSPEVWARFMKPALALGERAREMIDATDASL